MTSVTPTCSNDSAAVEVVARSYDDIRNGDRRHASLLLRIDYICIGYDGQQVSDNLPSKFMVESWYINLEFTYTVYIKPSC